MPTKVGMYRDGDRLIVPIQMELRNEVINQLQSDILEEVRAARLKSVIIDLGGVSILDTYQAKKIFATGKMARLMGATTVFTSLSAGIVISLVDLGFELEEVHTAISIEEGGKLLKSMQSNPPEETDEGIDIEPEPRTNGKREEDSGGSDPNDPD